MCLSDFEKNLLPDINITKYSVIHKYVRHLKSTNMVNGHLVIPKFIVHIRLKKTVT